MVLMGRPSKAIKWVDFTSRVSSGSMMGPVRPAVSRVTGVIKPFGLDLRDWTQRSWQGRCGQMSQWGLRGSASQARLAGSAFPSVGRETWLPLPCSSQNWIRKWNGHFLGLPWLEVQIVKKLPAMQETWVRSLGWEDTLEKGMVTLSSILAWRIPWTEELGGPQSMRLEGVRHAWATDTFSFMATSWPVESAAGPSTSYRKPPMQPLPNPEAQSSFQMMPHHVHQWLVTPFKSRALALHNIMQSTKSIRPPKA